MSFSTSQLAGLQTTKYFNVAGMAILIYDYAITVGDEARWVWGRNWDATRCIFTVSRYLPFVGVGMTAYAALRSTSQPCPPSLEENIIHIIGIIAAELLLVLRTCAFWQSDKRVLYGLLAYATVTIAAGVAINVVPVQLLPEGPVPRGCLLIASRNSTFVYLCLVIFETVQLLLSAYKQFRAYRNVRTNLLRTIYRDGMFYMLCVILITFANVIVDGIFQVQFSNLLDVPQVTLHSVLASRILFNLRETTYYAEGNGSTDLATLSDIAYNSPPDLLQRSVDSEWLGRGMDE